MPQDNRDPLEIEYSLRFLLAGASLEEANKRGHKQTRIFYQRLACLGLILFFPYLGAFVGAAYSCRYLPQHGFDKNSILEKQPSICNPF